MGRSICTLRKGLNEQNVGYIWLALFHDEHYNVPNPSIWRLAELLHHIFVRGNGVLRTAALGNHLESHWITKMFIANHPKILGHFPKEITSPTLLYRHGWMKKIAQAFRCNVGWELGLMPLDSEHQTPACLLSLLLSCTFPSWEYHRGSCAVQGLQVPLSQTQHLRVFFTAADFRVWENKGRRE